jgi:hypothetical protein
MAIAAVMAIRQTKENKMKSNIGMIDKVIRVIVGLFVLSLTIWGPKTAWGLLGLLPIFTAAIGWCPPYSLLGISTKAKTKSQSPAN